MATGRRGFGAIRRLPSKRYQASYLGPDLARYVGPKTFQARIDAEGWLAQERRLIETERWIPPNARDASRTSRVTLQAFAADAIPRRRVRGESLRPRTVKLYEGLMDRVIGPQLGHKTLHELRRADVNKWYSSMPADKATQRSHAYALLRSLFEQAIDEGSLAGPNPCAIRGAGVTRRRREIRPASLNELAALVDETQDNLKAAVLLAAWCASASGRCSNCAATTSTSRLERSTSGERSFASTGSRSSVGRNRTPASGPSPYPRTFSPLSSIISNATSGKPGTHCSSLPFMASTGPTATSTRPPGFRPGRPLAAQIYGSMIFAIPLPCSPHRPAPPWRSSWHDSATAHPWQRCDTNTRQLVVTVKSPQRCHAWPLTPSTSSSRSVAGMIVGRKG